MVAQFILRASVFAIALCLLFGGNASASEPFFKGKQVNLIIGLNPGGGYDVYARLLGRHWGKHLPGNPQIIARTMHGAGSRIAAGHIYNVAPRDGLTVGAVVNGLPFEPLFTEEKLTFDPTKFTWIGNINKEVNLLVVARRSAVMSMQDLMQGKELVVASSGGAGSANTMPRILNTLLNTKIKIISGYKSSADGFLAMQRGEVDGRGMYWSSLLATQRDLYDSGDLRILVQIGLEKHPDLNDVPLVLDLARTPEDRRLMELLFASLTIGRPVLAPPGLPTERVNELQTSFDATVSDPELLAEARKIGVEVTPMSGSAVAAIINELYRSPPEIVLRAKTLWN
jgi:tripartite-type tricarboxylate transporter receptor subunit TctC